MNTATTSSPNRLAREKSPYLLQHQHNPVDWHPWSPEAFDKARQENKPIFLSIGYSTCHWCHVMERESFEDPAVADFLNQNFISIKVDREERPDVDRIYLAAVQAIGGQGGWPLTVFLTPDLKPFYGGTYFPPKSRHGLPGFLPLLHQIQQIWFTRHPEVVHSAAELHRRMIHAAKPDAQPDQVLTPSILHEAAAQMAEQYDAQQGGFGPPPKFPRPSLPAFLLRYGVRYRNPDAIDMVLFTCDRMAAGGIHDHLGGGFARYAVDAHWFVPHFEKMLYDNAQLAALYLDAFLASGHERFADTVRDILQYVQRDMTHPAGGFYSAEDADSEGKEGKFYCWQFPELTGLLTTEELAVATRYFGISTAGNFIDHSDPQALPNQNVLRIAQPSLTPAERDCLAAAKQKMFAARLLRVRPHLDDKILASWNGLMLGAFARAAIVLDDPNLGDTAERNRAFLQAHLWEAATKVLYHRWREGEHDQVQLLDAYAFMLSGMIDLYETTLQPDRLAWAVALAETLIAQFYDSDAGGFWQSPPQAEHLIMRFKEDYDGAEPSGNSVAILALLKLAAITQRRDFEAAAVHSLQALAPRMMQAPLAVPYALSALDFHLESPRRVVIAGDPADPATRRLLQAAHSVFQPNKIVLGNAGCVEPFARTLKASDGQATAYVCQGTACQPPTRDPAMIQRLLR